MRLYFPWHELLKALEEIETATTASPLQGDQPPKGLLLIFDDDGIYLVPNTTDGVHHKNDQPRVTVFAQTCDLQEIPHDFIDADQSVQFLEADGLIRLAATPLPAAITPTNLVVRIEPDRLSMTIHFDTKH